MATQLTEADARESMNAHVESKGLAIQGRYGPNIGWNELLQLLDDRTYVRYPCKISFDTTKLQPGEFAFPEPTSDALEDGFVIHVHPHFENQPDAVPSLVLYQLVAVNYGEFASPDDAETFGAAALGLSKNAYYESLCQLADQVPGSTGGCG
jgi:hypothetical protein